VSKPSRFANTYVPLRPQVYDRRDQAELRKAIEQAFVDTNAAIDGYATGYANLKPDWDNDDVIIEIGATDLDTSAAYFEVSLVEFVEPTKESDEVLAPSLPYIEPAGLSVDEGDTVYLWVKFWSASNGFGQSVKTTLTRQTIPPSELIPSLVIESETESGDTATIGLLLSDPGALASRVEYRYRVGFKGEWEAGDTEEELTTSWTLRVARPFGLGEPYPGTPIEPLDLLASDYPITVPIIDYPPTFVEMRLEYEWQGGFFYTSPIISSGFDTGKLSTLAASVVLDKDWNASVQVQGDFDTKSIKVGFVEGATVQDTDLTSSAIASRAAVNGRVFSVTAINAAYSDIPVALPVNERVIFGIIGYNEADGGGDPAPPIYVRAERQPDDGGGERGANEVQITSAELFYYGVGDPSPGIKDRQILTTVVVEPTVKSLRVQYGPVLPPTGTAIQGSYNFNVSLTSTELLVFYVGSNPSQSPPDSAINFPEGYDADTFVTISGYDAVGGSGGTGAVLSTDRAVVSYNAGLPVIPVAKGTTTVQGSQLVAGSGLALTTVSGNPSVSVSETELFSATPLPIAKGGTGATTASTARTNLGAGTVTSVASGTGLTGGPITGEGTLALTGQALNLFNQTSTGFFVRTGAGEIVARSIAVTPSNAITITNGNGSTDNPTLQMSEPGPITATSSNSNGTNHTHELHTAIADVTVAGSAPPTEGAGSTPARSGSLYFVV
jgi:hypothetical protein